MGSIGLGLGLNPYPGKWGGGKMTQQSTFATVSPKLYDIRPMRFRDIIEACERYLLPYKVLSHLNRKCGHDGVKPEVHFRKSAKSRMPDCRSHDYKQQTLSLTTFIFSWTPGPNLLLGMVSWRQYSPEIPYG